ncbi:MAG: VOC family protein [Acidobacteriota bacterium]|nr:VOC family protein [Acidobacteriota bacterium]
MPVETLGIDHIYLTVSDMDRSERYYDQVMPLLGFWKSSSMIAGALHLHYINRHFGFTLRPAETKAKHDSYAPGLHHFCFRLADNAAVDRFYEEMTAQSIQVTEPAFYPEYAPDYYAVFFNDPDGIRLEATNFREERKQRYYRSDAARLDGE